MKKKLLIATDNFPPRWDGIGRFLTNTVPLLNKSFEITILHPDYGEYNLKNTNQQKIPLSNFTISDYKIPKIKPRTVKKHVKDADIVFGQTIGPIGFLSARYAKKYNKTYIPYIHSVEWNLVKHVTEKKITGKLLQGIVKLVARNTYKKATEIYVPSKQTEEEIYWNNIDRKTKIIHLGVNTKLYKPPTEEDKDWIKKKKKDLGIQNKKVIGFHGRIAPEKDLITLLRSVKRLKRKDIVLLVIGEGLQEIRGILERDKKTLTLGPKEDIHRYLHLFDVFVSPSLIETTSLSTVEALSTGIPTLATPAGYIPDYIEHGENGFTFPFRDSYTLSKLIQRVLTDKKLRKRLGKNGRKTAKQKFSWDKTVQELKQAFSEHT